MDEAFSGNLEGPLILMNFSQCKKLTSCLYPGYQYFLLFVSIGIPSERPNHDPHSSSFMLTVCSNPRQAFLSFGSNLQVSHT